MNPWLRRQPDTRLTRHVIAIVRTNISSVTPVRYRSVALYEQDGHRLSGGETAEMSEMQVSNILTCVLIGASVGKVFLGE